MKPFLTLMLAFFSAAVIAHHSPAVFYHVDQNINISGTVTEFRMGNPHIRIYFDHVNEDGETEQWLAEGGSRTVLLRQGWTGEEVKPGDFVTIHGNPSRDDKNIVHMIEIDLANGTRQFAEDLQNDVTDRLLEERRRNR